MVGQAVGAILSGQATTVLVFRSLNGRSGARYGLAHRVSSQPRIGGHGTYDEHFHPYGLVTPGQIFPIMAQRHFAPNGTRPEDLRAIAPPSRARGNTNPLAQRRYRP